MHAPPGQMTAPVVQARLKDGALAGEWALDPRKSSIRLMSKSIGLIPVNGVFREVGGNGAVAPDGEVSGIRAAYHIWDMARFQRQRNSRGHKELLDIDFVSTAPGHH